MESQNDTPRSETSRNEKCAPQEPWSRNSHNTGNAKTPIRIMARAAARGVFFFVASLLTACGSGGGGAAPTPAPVTAVPATPTKALTLQHGLGFVCTAIGASPQLIYCWASEQAAINNGDAGRVGVTSLTPQLMFNAPGTTTMQLWDHGLCIAGNCAGTFTSTVNTWTETNDCTVTGADSVHCDGEANPDLTFSGETFAGYFPTGDLRLRHTPHSITWRVVRKTA